MNDKIRVNYPALQEMAQHCVKVAQKLSDTQQMAAKVAAGMVDGALVGDTGEQFAAALNGPFSASVGRLQEKFMEVSQDIRNAIADMQAADRSAGGNF
ncbi:MAG: WXG100 family type VII secretion target [Anaerolineales bacterium]|jgi:WXG100 family type VII secretion target